MGRIAAAVKKTVKEKIRTMKIKQGKLLTHEDRMLAEGRYPSQGNREVKGMGPSSPYSIRVEKAHSKSGSDIVVTEQRFLRAEGFGEGGSTRENYIGAIERTYDSEGRLKREVLMPEGGKRKVKVYSPHGRFIGKRVKQGK